ncbi:MSHA biogenesis protein MshI [Paraglaciecola aquimarina]|uniref:MSHA biogenesis protein MshI n=1 Tax=Paraglaciecola aquimarina TaxID=1235557 RepID=A0ABU3SSY8_9ALTE|nr:MSHA biogenesis protein MshI [Paraglaciecola aquimarina]MDU0353131.1 MSHA biogenesis protein MshI [Paraglaciecola aquimarina]
MNIGWREYIKSSFRQASKFHSIGIEFGMQNLHISCLQNVNGLLTWVHQETIKLEEWQEQLKSVVEQQKWLNTRCNVVLSISKYQIMQLDKPAVEDAEVAQALQWSVKEHFPSDESLVIDYFDPPNSLSKIPQVNVVAIPEEEICEIRNGVLNAGLVLAQIGIEELAICKLLPFSEEAAIVLKQEQGGQLSLNIIKQGKLFFSRRLSGYENLGSLSPEELAMGIVDNLGLEVQRSMDYFESQLRQAPVKKLYLALDTAHQEALAVLIKDLIFISVEKFTPEIDKEQSLELSPNSFTSLGAALIGDEVSPE